LRFPSELSYASFKFFKKELVMRPLLVAVMLVSTLVFQLPAFAQGYMGNLSSNPYLPPAPAQPPGAFNNPYGTDSNSPKLFNQQGQFRGNLNSNRYDPNSVANPYGRYGSPYSPESTNNPYGAGSPYRQDSPTNPYGTGLGIFGPE
jgi:hypothetical protein